MVKFTDFELDIIEYAVDYLLDAELLEEDGWTKKDIKALNTIRDKIVNYGFDTKTSFRGK